MQPTLSPQQFVDKWRQASLKESAAAQEHFIDLCRLVGHPTPAEADPTGQTFAFEAGAAKQSGGQGYADVWKKGCFAWEYKGQHADLDRAYRQLLQYREALQNPPLLVVCDLVEMRIHTNFTNSVKRVVALTLDDLLTPDGLAQLRAVFDAPEAFRAPQTTDQVTHAAAIEFARLAELLRLYGADPQPAAHLLIRLLFCLFAEDIGLLPKNLFSHLIQSARRRADAFTVQLRQLFAAMSTGGWFGADEILHFDGRLFDDDAVLSLDSDSLDILARVSALDWANIEPAILGTLFERSLDPAKRAQLGAHYTSKQDIELIVEPVLVAPLRRRWAKVQQQARDLAARRDEATGRRARENRQAELSQLLTAFAQELAAVRVLDPACGSGNFLYVALKQLLDLWKAVSTLAGELGLPLMLPLPGLTPSPDQLYGIETNAYARELAQATIWIGYIQWLHDNGFGLPPEPILKPLDNVYQMDAILARDAAGRPAEPAWPAAEVIIGNPPFLGDKKMRAELGDEYVEDLRGLYAGRIPGQSDLVCYWFEKARAMIESGNLRRAGLLATQGIRGGANRKVLERIKQTGDIFWAQSDRAWILEGANVHVSMIGFDGGEETARELDGRVVESINSDLSSAVDLTFANRLPENQNLSFIGTQKTGPFDLTDEQAQAMMAIGGNPNGRPNSDVIRPWINALDVTRRPRHMWIIDFGVDMPLEEATQYEKPFEYVKQHVKPVRDEVRRKNHREKWWLFGETRPGMRRAVSRSSRYIATPLVSKHKVFVWIPAHVIPENLLVVIARDDDYFFGVLHSRIHELWTLRQGTSLEDRPRYTPTTTFETFPFPWPPGQEPQDDPRGQAIAHAARQLVVQRDRWLDPASADAAAGPAPALKNRTLTNLYNRRPAWLDLAHRRLDEAVLQAYGWPRDLDDDDLLARLLALNHQRAP